MGRPLRGGPCRTRIGDIAAAVGLTERTVQAIIADLEAAGYLTRTRVGRRTVYTIHPDCPFRPPLRTHAVSARSSSCWQPPATVPAMRRVPGRGPPAVIPAAARPAIPPLAPDGA